ncbi:HD-GYP domain-containing protein [bacterium]|nr:HD-GYP domain-containing protein [bacterium]
MNKGVELTAEIEELSPKVIGRKLGKNLYNSNGNVLLREGVEIVSSYYKYFEKSGYRSIYLLPVSPIDAQPQSQLLSSKLLAAMPTKLREVFRILQYGDRAKFSQAKESLISLATAILDGLNFNLQTQPALLDLKRQEDYLYQHSVNVAAYSMLLGKRLAYDNAKLLSLGVAALVHDFGMVFIDDEIVNKTSRLENKEFEIVQQHTIKGFQFLFNFGFLDPVCSLASAQHHENFDGTGYPHQLAGQDLHKFSRIIALTDFFDAWTSDRPHRRMHSIPKALEFVKQGSGRLFDPQISTMLVDMLN